jgi:hypothetical protein
MRIENYQFTDGALQASYFSEIRGEQINRRFALNESNVMYAADGRVRVLLLEAQLCHVQVVPIRYVVYRS